MVDGLDNRMETAYTAWPDRMFLIAPGGRLLYKSRPGPFGFDADDPAAALKQSALLGTFVSAVFDDASV